MAIELKVPALGESITEATIAKWLKGVGDAVAVDEPVVELETDKVTVSLPAPAAGVLAEQRVKVGQTVKVGAVVGMLNEGAGAKAAAPEKKAVAAGGTAAGPALPGTGTSGGNGGRLGSVGPAWQQPTPMMATGNVVSAAPVVAAPATVASHAVPAAGVAGEAVSSVLMARLTPAQRQALREADGASVVTPVIVPLMAGPGGAQGQPMVAVPQQPAPAERPQLDRDQVVAMTPLRRRIAERLVEAQKTAAILTTFNEVDMHNVMALRATHQEAFQKKHGIKLGFMSFFVKATIEALKEWPTVNAEIRGTDIVFKKHYDIGIAVGSGKGLVVPVVRDADRLGFAELEKAIADYGTRARDNKLTLPELQGGTFTISNGGIYGSMLSTPLLNMPQAGILGMHNIVKRPVVIDDKIEIRPMMFLALSYDHRLVDGREAVSFLLGVKHRIEQPERLLFGL